MFEPAVVVFEAPADLGQPDQDGQFGGAGQGRQPVVTWLAASAGHSRAACTRRRVGLLRNRAVGGAHPGGEEPARHQATRVVAGFGASRPATTPPEGCAPLRRSARSPGPGPGRGHRNTPAPPGRPPPEWRRTPNAASPRCTLSSPADTSRSWPAGPSATATQTPHRPKRRAARNLLDFSSKHAGKLTDANPSQET